MPSSHVWVQLYSWFVGNSLRISVAILHVLTTMVPDYTRTSNRFHFEHHHEKPFREDSEGMICPATRLAILSFMQKVWCAIGMKSLSEDTLSCPSTLPEPHLRGRSKPHTEEKQLCCRVNGLLHFRLFSGLTEDMMKRREVGLWK